MSQTILLAGGTGMFGGHIARQLLGRPDARLRLLVRSAQNDALKPLLDLGAEVVEGDLNDSASLDRATRGIDVIVSAVQGGQDVIVNGQIALAQAGKLNGVRRILPSDYALDLFKTTPGEHMMFDLRAKADEKIAATGLEHVHILQGAFMEMFGPKMGTIDYEARTVTFWGDGTQVIDCTSVESTALMLAHVALDRGIKSGKFAFAGDRVSILDAANLVEAQTGRLFERRSLGSEADLRAAMAAARKDPSDPFKPVMLAYQLYMLTGQTALSELRNNYYTDVKLETFAEFAQRALPKSTGALAVA